jgi:hypothetical protein
MYWIIKTKNADGEIESKYLKAPGEKERIIEVLTEVWDVEIVSLEPDPDVAPGADPIVPSLREDVMEYLRNNVKPSN